MSWFALLRFILKFHLEVLRINFLDWLVFCLNSLVDVFLLNPLQVSFSARNVNLFSHDVEQDENVDSAVKGHQIQEVPGDLIPDCRVFHIVGVDVEHLNCDQNNDLVKDLDEIVQTVCHRHYTKVEAKECCAQEVCHTYLKNDRGFTHHDGKGKK